MKKILISMALLLCAGTIMAQDKEAMKLVQKEAKALVGEAEKIAKTLSAKVADKSATEDEQISENKKIQALLRKAIKSGGIAENKLGETYKMYSEAALAPHNLMLAHASNKEPFDTAFFYTNLKALTTAIQGEVKNTKVTKGESGNEKYINSKIDNLAKCGLYYIYAAQFNGAIKQYDKALEAYEIAMSYTNRYPEVASMVKLPVSNEQIAYYAFTVAKDAKNYDKMDELYEQAIQFEQGALGIKQMRAMSYLERGDSTAWAGYIRDITIKEPKANQDFMSSLIAYYLNKDKTEGTAELIKYCDDVIAIDPSIYVAHYGKAYQLFEGEKYDEALQAYLKCTELDPGKYDSWFQAGLCKYKPALALNSKVSSIKNQTEAKTQLAAVKKMLEEAIPYFEKARECVPDDPSKWAYELRTCYNAAGQTDKAEEMDKLM